MQTVAVVSQKGGSGKTTVCVHLAVCAQLHRKRVAIIDLDPQGSAKAWAGQRAASSLSEEVNPTVVKATPERLRALLAQADAEHADFCFVDTAPHSSSMAAAAMHVADLVLIPCQPSFFDLAAIGSSVAIAATGKSKASVLLNRCPPRGGQVEAAHEALDGVQVVPVELHQRVAYARAVSHGLSVQEFEPDGAAAIEIERLYKWIVRKGNA